MKYIFNVHDWLVNKYIPKYNASNTDNQISDYQSLSLSLRQAPYSVLHIQPETCLNVDPQSGLISTDENYHFKFVNFFDKTFTKKYDIVLTPEYAVPLSAIEYLTDKVNAVKVGTLYCLGCEGVLCSEFSDFLKRISEKGIVVVDEVFKTWQEYNTICCLLYFTKIKFYTSNNDVVEQTFVFPQFKTTPMKDLQLVFEASSMSVGHMVYCFGKPEEVSFLSIICSDVFNYSLLVEIKEYLERNKTIIFHPQLNSKPLNDYFRLMRNMFISYAAQDTVRILSLNWSDKTQFLISGKKSFPIQNSWSGLFNLYQEDEFKKYVSILEAEAINGLNIAHDHHVMACYFGSDEQIVDWSIRQLANAGRPIDIQDNIILKINSVEYFDTSKYTIKKAEHLCEKMIDGMFRQEGPFDGILQCSNCKNKATGLCGIGKLNTFMSLLLNGKLSSEFEIINDGNVTSLTSKHYKSKYSREKIFICKRVQHLLESGDVTLKFRFGTPKIEFCVLENGLVTANVRLEIEGEQPVDIRVIYLKYAEKQMAQSVFDSFCHKSPGYAENLIIYYEDETGTQIYPDDSYFNTSITTGKITESQVSILGGH